MDIFSFVGVDIVSTVQIVSLIPIVLLLIVNYYKVRENFGWFVCGLFSFCIVFMPKFMFNSIECRMYSWAMFFLTVSFIYLYNLIKKPNFKNWAIFTILTICSAYTHYFAAIGSIILYVLFLAYIIFKNRSLLKNYILSVICCIVAYLPWVNVVLSQINNTQDYWILPIEFKTVVGYLYYVFSPTYVYIIGNQFISPTVLGTIFILVLLFVLIFSFKGKTNFNEKYAYLGISIVILTCAVGIIISFLTHPILHYRYIYPAMGCFWLGICILINKIKKDYKLIATVVVAIILLIGCVATLDFVHMKNNAFDSSTALNESVNSYYQDNSIIIYKPGYYSYAENMFLDNSTCIFIEETNTTTIEDHDMNTIHRIKMNVTSNLTKELKEKFKVDHVYLAGDNDDWLKSHEIVYQKIVDSNYDPFGLMIDVHNVYELK